MTEKCLGGQELGKALKNEAQDFPGDAVIKCNNTESLCKGQGFKIWSGKIPHAAEQLNPLSPCTTTTEPACCNYWSPRAATSEARVPRAHALQQEKPPQ